MVDLRITFAVLHQGCHLYLHYTMFYLPTVSLLWLPNRLLLHFDAHPERKEKDYNKGLFSTTFRNIKQKSHSVQGKIIHKQDPGTTYDT